MDHKLVLAILSVYALAFLPNLMHGVAITSCSQTPYPDVCNHYIIASNLAADKEDASELSFPSFRYASLEVSMQQAIESFRVMSTMDQSSLGERAKLAWADCLELQEDTIGLLNRSLSTNSDPIDSQTWLSAAVANHQTCQNGFIDFGLSSHLNYLPPMNLLGNFSKLLSNSLAINKFLMSRQINGPGRRLLRHHDHSNIDEEFPIWVSASDRKLLQSTTVKADVVVAQDGSGNYKSISEAVAAAARMKGSGRLVIYVKRGVYKENVEIKTSMKNVMMIGDGIDATVISASKSVDGGSTTFGSATMGN